jgi:hypothetical protein
MVDSPPIPAAEPLPPANLPTAEVLSLMRKRFDLKAANAQARRWREFKVPTDGPYALMLFGDPHIDDDGCNWGLLENHCDLARETEHLYAISVGDATNNWVGRLTDSTPIRRPRSALLGSLSSGCWSKAAFPGSCGSTATMTRGMRASRSSRG